ncbi:SH3 domain-containing kinase-binding protein 1 [Engraulis encrasicolus]|uniref:SH3 domain-containing kinase-binding protein 1 n=1 Tax=Engraulis encrasicolus TaxID=184585 RepID=UPI002FD73E5E
MGNYTSALTDIEEFKAIISNPGRLSPELRRHTPFRRSQSEVLLASSPSPPPDPSPPIMPSVTSEKPELLDSNGPDILALKFLHVVYPSSDAITDSSPRSPSPSPSPSSSSDVRASATPSPPPSPSSSSPASPLPPSLFSGALSTVLHNPRDSLKAVPPSGSPALDHLRRQLGLMREELDKMKSQHKKEVKQLVSELDEEKKARLNLQVEVDKIKRQLTKSSSSSTS